MRADDFPAVATSEFLLAALEQANDAVIIVDSDRRVRHFNAASERIWGLPRTDVLGCEASRLGLPDPPPQPVALPLPSQARAGTPRKSGTEITIRHYDGRPVRVALSVSRVETGGQTNTMVFVRDITAEVERRERTALLNLVADKTNRVAAPRAGPSLLSGPRVAG